MWGGQGWLSLSSTVVTDNELPDNDADVVMIIKCGSQLTHGVQSSLVDFSGMFFFSRLFIYMEVYQKGNGKHAIPRRATLNTAHSLYTW